MTPDEIGTLSVFAALEPADLEWLCRVAADISLGPGEFAVHAGDLPALFVLLEGRIEFVTSKNAVELKLLAGRLAAIATPPAGRKGRA